MTIVLTNAQKTNLIKKARSGDYHLRLTNYSDKIGQHIFIHPTEKGLKKGITNFKNVYPVRPPNIPRPGKKPDRFNRKGGVAHMKGRFFVINGPMAKVLRYSPKE